MTWKSIFRILRFKRSDAGGGDNGSDDDGSDDDDSEDEDEESGKAQVRGKRGRRQSILNKIVMDMSGYFILWITNYDY